MKIEEAELKDAKTIQHVMYQAFQANQDDQPPSGALKETVEDITEAMKDGQRALIVYNEAEPVGVVRFTAKEDGWYFSRLSVLPEMQGRGIAKQLATALEELSLKEENHYLFCKVRKSAQKSIALYETWGYDLFHEEVIQRSDGVRIEAVSMEKTLS